MQPITVPFILNNEEDELEYDANKLYLQGYKLELKTTRYLFYSWTRY